MRLFCEYSICARPTRAAIYGIHGWSDESRGACGPEAPLKGYCTGLLLPGERKSVEPMAERVGPDNVRRPYQSLHHVVGDAPWNDEAMLEMVCGWVLPRI